MPFLPWLSAAIVAATIIGIAVGRWPWLRADRTTIALLGAAMLLAVGALSLDQALAALDLRTLLLLFSMMVLNANLFFAGFFGVVVRRLVHIARGPRTLLALIIVASGILSAFFLNDTIVLMLTPLVIDTTRALKRRPLPYLLGLATAANVGSAAAITGNPQNIVIGSASRIPFTTFSAALAPVSLIGLVLCWLVIVIAHRAEFRPERFAVPDVARVRVSKPLLRKASVVLVALFFMFLLGVPVALASFLAAAVMMATRRIKPGRVFKALDWSLLVFFSALFVVTHALETQGLTAQLFAYAAPLARGGLVPFGLLTALLSNLISNVPAVLVLQGLVPAMADPQRAWL
ncbi:MAG TPA: SLC13 family permease, partial [Roseiflexaceae bacterium]|nr:SLC13 family permease [Roseiflexaceae bacterium]